MQRTRTNIGKQKKNSSVQNVATKRLLKDWKQIELEPLPGVAAAPLEKNLFCWHANLKGPKDTPWEGGIFHLVMNFPSSYPDDPPTITLCTRIEHPNVHGQSICLDMLEKRDQIDDVTKYEGWSAAYTVQSILIQLQAFLFEAEVSKVLSSIQNPQDYEKKKKEWLSGVKWSVEQSLGYNDKSVGHHPPRSPWPAFKDAKDTAQHLTQEQMIKDELVCYYTRQSFEEDCLGFGISYAKNMRTGEIKSIQSPLDFVSLRAFMNHDLRLSSMNEKFTHWLPIFINQKHGEKAMYLARRALSIICTGNNKNFSPEQVLSVFPKLMSTQVVEVMSGRKHASLRALRGYCFFHRMLLEFVNQYPELQQRCNDIVKEFISNENNRHKDTVPNLGEFLAFLPVSDFAWSDVRDSYIDESFVRNVFWLLAKYPELEELNNKEFTDADRLQYSFDTTKTSQKLLHFQVFFLEKIAKPKGVTRQQVIDQYDQNYGRPSSQLEDMFLSACERINEMKNYKEFFEGIGINASEQQIIDRLKSSITRSREKGYHGSTLSVLSPEEFAKENRDVDLEKMLHTVDDKQVLEENDEKWKDLCEKRWGFQTLPEYLLRHSNPWRKLYLQNNLQDLLANLNDAPDLANLHKVLDVSGEVPHLEIHMFDPTNIKSRYHFITIVVSKIKSLDTLIIRKGEIGMDVKGFKALTKGLANNPGCLSSLILDYCGITAQSIEELTKGKLVSASLKKLVLTGNPLQDQGAIHLAQFLRQQQNLPHLEELDLSDCKIGINGARAIAEALLVKRELRTLKLLNNPLATGLGEIIKNLSYNPSITELDASKVTGSFSDRGVETLAKLLKLSITVEKLNLWKIPNLNTLDTTVFDELEKNESLRVLDLGDTNFNNLHLLGRALHKNTILEELNLQNNAITSTILFNMHEELKKEKGGFSIRKLILSGNQLQTVAHGKEKHKRVMGQILQMATNLTYLDLNNCHLDKEHMVTIGEALKPENKLPLKTLLLRKNQIGKFGLKPLSQALKTNTVLEKLDLSGNDLGVLGANLVAGMLLENKGLQELNIFGNFIEIEGAIMLAEALGVNTTLKRLDMGLNRIRVRGALAVAKVLEKNTTLERLALKHNHISDKAGMAIARAIASDTSAIKYVALAGNYLSVPTRSEIAVLFNQVNGSVERQREVEFDLAKLVEVKDPEKQERTIYVTPLPMNVTEQQLKKLFYSNKCGVCLNVSIHMHKAKTVFSKAKYAFIEFAHPHSTDLAIRLVHSKKNRIGGNEIRIARAGIQNKHNAVPEKTSQPVPQRGAQATRGGFGGGRGGRGGARSRR